MYKRQKLFLKEFVRKGRLCDKLVGLDDSEAQCSQFDLSMCKGACIQEEDVISYNTRFAKTLEEMVYKCDSFFVKDLGRSIDEFSVAWIQNGEYKGCGFFNHDITDYDEIKNNIPVEINKLEVLKMIKSYIVDSKLEIIPLESSPNEVEGGVLTLF